jgi:hypothetical protein
VQAFEERHGHCARNVAWHAKPSDQEEDRNTHRSETNNKFLDRPGDSRDKARMLGSRFFVGFGLGGKKGCDHAGRHHHRHAEVGGAPADGVGKIKRAGARDEIANSPSDLRPGRH